MSALPTPSRPAARPLALASDHLDVATSSSFADLAPSSAAWDRLVVATGAPVDMTVDWCRTWWDHYGGDRTLRVQTCRAAGDLVGVLPMFIDDVRVGPARLRLAKIIGADFGQTICVPPLQERWRETACEAVVERLLGDEHCDAVLIGPVPAESPTLAAARRVAAARPELALVRRDRVVTRQVTIALPARFDDYLAGLSRNGRQQLRRAERRLAATGDVVFEAVTDPGEIVGELDAFMAMHAAQWAQRGKLGHFGDWPGAAAYHRALGVALGAAPGARGRLRLNRLRVDDQVVARQYGYALDGTWSCRAAARDPDPRWDRHGLGRLSLVKLFEQAIAEGVTTIDAGVGRYAYKERLGGQERDVCSLLLVANRPGARRRAALFGRLADAVDRLYYRTWHYRVAPRLPGGRRSLHRTWIRSRI